MSDAFTRDHEGISKEIDDASGAACRFSEEISVVHTRLARLLGRELADSNAQVRTLERELASANARADEGWLKYRETIVELAAAQPNLQLANARIAELEQQRNDVEIIAQVQQETLREMNARIADLSRNQCEKEPVAWYLEESTHGLTMYHTSNSTGGTPLYQKAKL